MPGGNVGHGVAVDLTRHFDGLGPVDPETRTVRVGAGVILARVDEAARKLGLFFPPRPSSAHRCTVGGVVANNAAGARTFGYGAVRDWVEGCSVVLSDGQVVEVGGEAPLPSPFDGLHRSLSAGWPALRAGWPRVRKNSSGYALDRFLPQADSRQLVIGSEGTLAIVTEANLRLALLPPDRAVALLGVRELEHVAAVCRRAAALKAAACEFFGRRFIELTRSHESGSPLPGSARALLLVELEGTPEQTAHGLDALLALARELGAEFFAARDGAGQAALWALRHGASPAVAAAAERGLRSAQFIEDSVVPPDRLTDYVRGVEAILASAEMDAVIFGHAGDGNVHVNPLVPAGDPDWPMRVRHVLDATTDLVARLGGTLTGEHGDGRLRAPLLDRIWGAPAVEAFRRVKSALDPEGILNPGVILPLPGQDPLAGLGAAWASSVSAAG
jgi:FAD/FMN-containing dehydrogenase